MYIHWLCSDEIFLKEALTNGIDTQILIPYKDFSKEWKDQSYLNFHDWCLDSSNYTGKYYFKFFYKEGKIPWFNKYIFERKQVFSISRLRSGHTSLRSSLYRFNITPDCLCTCGGDQTTEHVILQCENFNQQREGLLKILKKKWGLEQINVEKILNLSKYT